MVWRNCIAKVLEGIRITTIIMIPNHDEKAFVAFQKT